jgi:hypothetical protein
MVNPTGPFEAFRHYDSCHANGVVQQPSKLQIASRRLDHLLQNASKLERHMLEELQLQVGHLILQESKESIKQSQIAIEESKRVKMRTLCCPRHWLATPCFELTFLTVTTLAFVFIPISFATSIFGMNI